MKKIEDEMPLWSNEWKTTLSRRMMLKKMNLDGFVEDNVWSILDNYDNYPWIPDALYRSPKLLYPMK